MIWRLVVLLLYGPAFALAIYLGEFARSAGTLGNLALALALLAMAHGGLVAATEPRRKADPAKIARLEQELGIVEAERAEQTLWAFTETGDIRLVPQGTVKPPEERNVEDCPRPEGCVIAHPCRKCGADRGRKCVGDDLLDEMEF